MGLNPNPMDRLEQALSAGSIHPNQWSRANAHFMNVARMVKVQGKLVSVPFSSVRWKHIKDVYEDIISPHAEPTSEVPTEVIDTTVGMLTEWQRGDDKLEKDRAAVATSLMELLSFDIRFDREESVYGQRIHCHGKLDCAIKWGSDLIGVLEMKQGDLVQGKTQALLGCEVLRDLCGLSETIGIVSTLEKWILMRVKDGQVLVEEDLPVTFDESGQADRASVEILAGKLQHFLANPSTTTISTGHD